MKRALITGITGQDGSYLAELLLEKGYRVFGLVRRTATRNTKNIEHILNKITLIEGEITDFFCTLHIIGSLLPDEIYNLAAQSHVGTSFEQPAYTLQVNTVGVSNIIEAIKLAPYSIKLYQASTSEIFGNNRGLPLNEDSPMKPRSPYGCSKLAAHHLVRCFREEGFFACSGILFNHESPRRGENFVTRKITKGVAEIYRGKRDVIELGNVHARRDWGYARDYVVAMWMMLQQENPADFVIGTGMSHSVEDVLEIAFHTAGILDWSKHVIICDSEHRPTDIGELVADASRAHGVLGWQPRTTFKQLIEMMANADRIAIQ